MVSRHLNGGRQLAVAGKTRAGHRCARVVCCPDGIVRAGLVRGMAGIGLYQGRHCDRYRRAHDDSGLQAVMGPAGAIR